MEDQGREEASEAVPGVSAAIENRRTGGGGGLLEEKVGGWGRWGERGGGAGGRVKQAQCGKFAF